MSLAYIILSYEKTGKSEREYLEKIISDLNKIKPELNDEYIFRESNKITIARKEYVSETFTEGDGPLLRADVKVRGSVLTHAL